MKVYITIPVLLVIYLPSPTYAFWTQKRILIFPKSIFHSVLLLLPLLLNGMYGYAYGNKENSLSLLILWFRIMTLDHLGVNEISKVQEEITIHIS